MEGQIEIGKHRAIDRIPATSFIYEILAGRSLPDNRARIAKLDLVFDAWSKSSTRHQQEGFGASELRQTIGGALKDLDRRPVDCCGTDAETRRESERKNASGRLGGLDL